MKIFAKPKNLNGDQLKAELALIGIFVETIRDFGDDTIGFETDEEVEAAKIVASHNGTNIDSKLTIEEKLASVGLNLSDLKQALGL